LESVVDCSAASNSFDAVIDRAALCYLDPKELKQAFGQVRRILRSGGVFYFNPYGHAHTMPPPDDVPEPYLYDEVAARRLFPDTKWDFVNLEHALIKWGRDGQTLVEHTLRIVVRKR
jgi:SAM-dependent methyltransferase